MWLRQGTGLLMAAMLWGCATVDGTPPLGSAPLFQADATDKAMLNAVNREQETLLSACTQKRQSCDQVHFTRAMIALFQNGEEATASFRQAIAAAPNGPFADSSALWIRFLANRSLHPASAAEPSKVALDVMKGLVRTWLEQQRGTSASSLLAAEIAGSPNLAIPILQRRIHDRDKRIAELTDQLNALKQIDLDVKESSKLSLPRAPSK